MVNDRACSGRVTTHEKNRERTQKGDFFIENSQASIPFLGPVENKNYMYCERKLMSFVTFSRSAQIEPLNGPTTSTSLHTFSTTQQLTNSSLHTSTTPPKRLHISIKIKEPHIIQLP